MTGTMRSDTLAIEAFKSKWCRLPKDFIGGWSAADSMKKMWSLSDCSQLTSDTDNVASGSEAILTSGLR